MRLRARVMACRAGRLLRALTGISASTLSSNHRWRKEDSPSKLLSGTREMTLASRRLVEERTESINPGHSLGLGWAGKAPSRDFGVPWD